MKKMLALLSGAAMLVPVSAAQAADTAQAQFNLSATAPNTCYIRSITEDVTPADVTFTPPTAGGNAVTGTLDYGDELADETTANALATTTELSVNAYCNYATHSVRLSSLNGGMIGDNASAVVGDFHNRITYDATIVWNGVTEALDATADKTTNVATPLLSAGSNIASAVNGTADLTIVTDADTVPLLQGTYTDTLTITFGPQI